MCKIKNITLLILIFLSFFSANVFAHCDGIDGPVVSSAKKSLETGDINYVLGWIKPEFEQQIIEAFAKTLKVRETGIDAMDLADNYFFETVVRLHREGEGAPFTGLKPAGRDLGPAISSVDESISSGSLKEVYNLLNESMHHKLHSLFDEVTKAKTYNNEDTESFRKYVDAYVMYIHFVEEIHKMISGSHGHNEEGHL
jgi:hypothetical protein